MQLSPAANRVLLEVAMGGGRRVRNVSASPETLLAGPLLSFRQRSCRSGGLGLLGVTPPRTDC